MTQTTTANFIKSIRQYFWAKDYTEVEIPYLNESLPLEPNIYSFKTTWAHKNKQYFLPTSPEFALKKFISKNKQDCFSISHCFRDLEDSNDTHTPEFLMLEWYEINKSLNELKKSTQKFINHFLPNLKFSELKLNKINFDNEPDFNQYFLNEVEPKLPRHGGVFITGYPAFLSPLASKNEVGGVNNFFRNFNAKHLTGEKNLFATANRFELYINGIEIANGCEENHDEQSIKNAMLSEQKYRQKNNLPTHPISNEFIKNCRQLPPSSGVGLGLDRLLKIINTKI